MKSTPEGLAARRQQREQPQVLQKRKLRPPPRAGNGPRPRGSGQGWARGGERRGRASRGSRGRRAQLFRQTPRRRG
jgi:hypothetical protein